MCGLVVHACVHLCLVWSISSFFYFACHYHAFACIQQIFHKSSSQVKSINRNDVSFGTGRLSPMDNASVRWNRQAILLTAIIATHSARLLHFLSVSIQVQYPFGCTRFNTSTLEHAHTYLGAHKTIVLLSRTAWSLMPLYRLTFRPIQLDNLWCVCVRLNEIVSRTVNFA